MRTDVDLEYFKYEVTSHTYTDLFWILDLTLIASQTEQLVNILAQHRSLSCSTSVTFNRSSVSRGLFIVYPVVLSQISCLDWASPNKRYQSMAQVVLDYIYQS